MGIKAETMKALMENIRQGLKNKLTGSSFEDFLIEENLEKEVTQSAIEKTNFIKKRIRLKRPSK